MFGKCKTRKRERGRDIKFGKVMTGRRGSEFCFQTPPISNFNNSVKTKVGETAPAHEVAKGGKNGKRSSLRRPPRSDIFSRPKSGVKTPTESVTPAAWSKPTCRRLYAPLTLLVRRILNAGQHFTSTGLS